MSKEFDADVPDSIRSYDNALAETINGLYKTEVICKRGSWKIRAAVELATLEWVYWFNHLRLLESIGDMPLAEAEEQYYREIAMKSAETVLLCTNSLHETWGDSHPQSKETFLAQLKKTWLPNVLVTLISSIITSALRA